MSEIWSDSGAILGVFGLLLAFGTLYNALVAWAARGLRAVEPMLDREMTETEKIRRLAIAVSSFQTILRMLEREGAQTRP